MNASKCDHTRGCTSHTVALRYEVHVESVTSEAMDDACSRNDTFPLDRGYEGLSGNTTSSNSNRKKLGSEFNSFFVFENHRKFFFFQ